MSDVVEVAVGPYAGIALESSGSNTRLASLNCATLNPLAGRYARVYASPRSQPTLHHFPCTVPNFAKSSSRRRRFDDMGDQESYPAREYYCWVDVIWMTAQRKRRGRESIKTLSVSSNDTAENDGFRDMCLLKDPHAMYTFRRNVYIPAHCITM